MKYGKKIKQNVPPRLTVYNIQGDKWEGKILPYIGFNILFLDLLLVLRSITLDIR